MINGKVKQIAGIAAVVLAVGGGAYLAGANGLGMCDTKAKARYGAMTSNNVTTCEKVHASTMASANGAFEVKAKNTAMASATGSCGAKATNAVMADAEACPYLKSQATKTAVVSAGEGDCPEGSCEMAGSGTCPMEKDGKGKASKKVENKKTAPKGAMASVVPGAEATK